jgi:hypothetical protein
VSCSNCNAASILSLDGKAITQTFATGEMDATVPLAMLPVPSIVTAHSFSAVNPIPVIN